MAKARFADGLRKGSTKSKTFSTLATQKEGRIQIVKDRVTDITNPQSRSQMIQRVCFATVTNAAAKMFPLISISTEGVTKAEYARQDFISRNVEFLKKVAGRRAGANLHYLAAYAPKNNQVLIPNSYIVSKGSLSVPAYLVPRTTGDAGSFGDAAFAKFNDEGAVLPALTIGSSYDAATLWSLLFGLNAGDQITVPQIYGDGIEQAMYAGESSDSELIDKTIKTTFCAPRLVLAKEMPTTTITISAETTAAQVTAIMRAGVNADSSFETLVDNFLNNLSIDEIAGDNFQLTIDKTYDEVYCVSNDDVIRAIGVILSRQDENGNWRYSTSQLTCVWDFIGENSGDDYFGFTLGNAISTYLKTVKKDGDGNFLQRGGTPDIIPESFQ